MDIIDRLLFMLSRRPRARVVCLGLILVIVVVIVVSFTSCVSRNFSSSSPASSVSSDSTSNETTDSLADSQTNDSQDDTTYNVTTLTDFDNSTTVSTNTSTIFSLGEDGILTVAIDPGHGAEDSGAIGVTTGIHESDICWTIATYCAQALSDGGARVVITRGQNENPSFEERTQVAVDANADVLISIHVNGNEETADLSGITTYYPNGTSTWMRDQTYLPGKLLAKTVQNNLTTLGMVSQGIKEEIITLDPNDPSDDRYAYPNDETGISDYLAMIRWPRVNGIPAILVEHGFLSSPTDEALLSDESMLAKMGQADASAILACFGVSQ